MPKAYGQTCPVAQSLEFLGERWTLLIVRDLLAGPRKFRDLSRSMTGVAPAVLSHRLKLLETHGIVSRRLYSDHPPRAEYTLTDRGRELRAVVRALGIWGARHLARPVDVRARGVRRRRRDRLLLPGRATRTVAADQVRRQPKPAPRRARPKRGVAQRVRAAKRARRLSLRHFNPVREMTMTITPGRRLRTALVLAAFLALAAPLAAQTPAPAAPTTAVLATLTVKADADRTKLPGVMPSEVRDTVRLYLDGKIQQWYARADGRGVVFILNAASVADAKALTDTLPLVKAGLVTFDYMALTPLTPLRMLLAEPAAPPKE